jgi:hypothetical protein
MVEVMGPRPACAFGALGGDDTGVRVQLASASSDSCRGASISLMSVSGVG